MEMIAQMRKAKPTTFKPVSIHACKSGRKPETINTDATTIAYNWPFLPSHHSFLRIFSIIRGITQRSNLKENARNPVAAQPNSKNVMAIDNGTDSKKWTVNPVRIIPMKQTMAARRHHFSSFFQFSQFHQFFTLFHKFFIFPYPFFIIPSQSISISPQESLSSRHKRM